jgi:hypothetical protein
MARGFSGITWGLTFIVIGGLMLLDNLHVIRFDFSDFIHRWWPLILIIIGLNIILKNLSGGDGREKVER